MLLSAERKRNRSVKLYAAIVITYMVGCIGSFTLGLLLALVHKGC